MKYDADRELQETLNALFWEPEVPTEKEAPAEREVSDELHAHYLQTIPFTEDGTPGGPLNQKLLFALLLALTKEDLEDFCRFAMKLSQLQRVL